VDVQEAGGVFERRDGIQQSVSKHPAYVFSPSTHGSLLRAKKDHRRKSIGDLFHLDHKVLIVRMDTALAAHQIARSTLPDLRQLVQTCILFFAPLTFTATFWTLEFQILLDLL
jgi:hypothetical protein